MATNGMSQVEYLTLLYGERYESDLPEELYVGKDSRELSGAITRLLADDGLKLASEDDQLRVIELAEALGKTVEPREKNAAVQRQIRSLLKEQNAKTHRAGFSAMDTFLQSLQPQTDAVMATAAASDDIPF